MNRPPTTNTTVVPRPPAIYGSEGQPKVFLCPSAPTPDAGASAFQLFVNGNAGETNIDWGAVQNIWFATQPGSTIMGHSNYIPSAGDWRTRPDRNGGARVDGHGIFGYFKNKVSVGRIPDGTSNTIMFAECAGGLFSGGAPFANNIWTDWSWGGGQWWAAYGICPNNNGVGINCQAGAGLGLSWVVAGSTHAGNVIQMAFADGSVHNINPSGMDIFILSYLTGMQDGETQGIDF